MRILFLSYHTALGRVASLSERWSSEIATYYKGYSLNEGIDIDATSFREKPNILFTKESVLLGADTADTCGAPFDKGVTS